MKRYSTFSIIGFALVVSLSCPEKAAAEAQPPATMMEYLKPLTAEETFAVERTTLSDQRVRMIVGTGQPRVTTTNIEVDKVEAEAYLAGRTETPPTRLVTVVLFNALTNTAARAVVVPEQNRVVDVQSIRASDVPLIREDADQALALVKADAAIRCAVGDTVDRFQILDPGNEARIPFAVQILPLRSADPGDPCSVDRCLDLIFRTENGYLPLRGHVDLTKRTVSVHGGGQH